MQASTLSAAATLNTHKAGLLQLEVGILHGEYFLALGCELHPRNLVPLTVGECCPAHPTRACLPSVHLPTPCTHAISTSIQSIPLPRTAYPGPVCINPDLATCHLHLSPSSLLMKISPPQPSNHSSAFAFTRLCRLTCCCSLCILNCQ